MFAILESLAWIGLLFFALRVIQLAYLPPFPSPSQLSVRLCRRVSSTTFLRKSSTRLSALFSGAGTVLSWVSFVFNTCRRAFYSLCSCLSSLYSFSSTVFSTSTNLRNPSHLTFNNILQVIFSNPRLTLEHAHTQGYTVQPASTFATSSSSPRQPKKKSAESFFRARMTADPDPLHQQLNEAKPGLDCAASTREGGRVWKGGYNLDMPKRAELEGGSVSMMVRFLPFLSPPLKIFLYFNLLITFSLQTGIALARMYRVADEELRKRDLSMPPFFQEDRPFCFLPEEIGGFWVA